MSIQNIISTGVIKAEKVYQFNTIAGQSTYTLPNIVIDIDLSKVVYEHNPLYYGVSFSIVGNTVTLTPDFNIETGDKVSIRYLYTI